MAQDIVKTVLEKEQAAEKEIAHIKEELEQLLAEKQATLQKNVVVALDKLKADFATEKAALLENLQKEAENEKKAVQKKITALTNIAKGDIDTFAKEQIKSLLSQ